MTPAAFQATYSDWRIIKGRKVIQVVLELPIEKADEAYQVLGGMPIAAREIWCAVARLDLSQRPSPFVAETQPRQVAPEPAGAKERRSFNELSCAQQAGMLSNDRAFRLFLAEKFDMPVPDPDEAAAVIRHHCKVKSRSEITKDNVGWSELVLAYRLWQNEPSVVPA